MLQSAPPHLRHFIVHLENTMWCTSTPKVRHSLHGCRRCLGKELLLPSMVYNRIAYDETNRKIGQNPRESWRMVPYSHPAIISWELFDEISALREAEYVLEILHERERKALICFSALERQEEKLSAEKAEIVKQRVALYEQYADGNMSKEEFIRQRDAYRVQEDEKMEQIQRLRTEKNQAFQPVKRDTDHLQTVMSTVEEAGDVMYLSQNVVETFIDRIEVFNDEHVKIHFTFENVLADYAE